MKIARIGKKVEFGAIVGNLSSFIEQNFDGNVSIKNICHQKIEIFNNFCLKFINYYSYFNDPKQKNIRISKSSLTGEFHGITDTEIDDKFFQKLDSAQSN